MSTGTKIYESNHQLVRSVCTCVCVGMLWLRREGVNRKSVSRSSDGQPNGVICQKRKRNSFAAYLLLMMPMPGVLDCCQISRKACTPNICASASIPMRVVSVMSRTHPFANCLENSYCIECQERLYSPRIWPKKRIHTSSVTARRLFALPCYRNASQ